MHAVSGMHIENNHSQVSIKQQACFTAGTVIQYPVLYINTAQEVGKAVYFTF